MIDPHTRTHPLAGQFHRAVLASEVDLDGDYPGAGLVVMSRRSGEPLYGWIEEVHPSHGFLMMLHVAARHSRHDRLDFREERLYVVMDDITTIREIAAKDVPVSPFPGV